MPQLNEIIGLANPQQRQTLMQILQRFRNPVRPMAFPGVPEGFQGNIPALKGPQARMSPTGRPLPPLKGPGA